MAMPSFNGKYTIFVIIIIFVLIGSVAALAKSSTGFFNLLPTKKLNSFLPGTASSILSFTGSATDKSENRETTMQLLVQLVDGYNNNDIVEVADKVTKIENKIKLLKDSMLTNIWQSITSCLASNCDKNSIYIYAIEAIEILSEEEYDKNGDEKYKFILSALDADRLWSTKDLVGFSNALTEANAVVIKLNDAEVSLAWKNYLKCAVKCSDWNLLKFELIKAVVR